MIMISPRSQVQDLEVADVGSGDLTACGSYVNVASGFHHDYTMLIPWVVSETHHLATISLFHITYGRINPDVYFSSRLELDGHVPALMRRFFVKTCFTHCITGTRTVLITVRISSVFY